MSSKIFYFTATGNSLYIARQIANGLDEAELIAIPEAMKQHIDTNVPMVGLIFPVFGWGMPRIVTDFVKELGLNNEQYVFAVATCGGTPSATLPQLQKILRKNGANLDAVFAVKEGHGGSASDPAIIKLVRSLNWKKPVSGTERINEIVEIVKNRQKHKPESSSLPANFLGGLFHEPFVNMAKTLDKNFRVDAKCNLCQTCMRICPRSNITIVDNQPVQHHNCEACGACYQWCLKQAIHNQSGEAQYYHHPEVKLTDLLLR